MFNYKLLLSENERGISILIRNEIRAVCIYSNKDNKNRTIAHSQTGWNWKVFEEIDKPITIKSNEKVKFRKNERGEILIEYGRIDKDHIRRSIIGKNRFGHYRVIDCKYSSGEMIIQSVMGRDNYITDHWSAPLESVTFKSRTDDE